MPPPLGQFNCSQIWEWGVAGHGGKRRPSSPCSCDCRSPCPFTSCPFVHELLSAGILNLFAVSGQGMQLLLDRTWICPENIEMLGWGWGWEWGTAALESCQRPYIHLHCSSQRSWDTPGHEARPRPISAPPPTSWAPPHLDSFLPRGGDLYPGLQLV